MGQGWTGESVLDYVELKLNNEQKAGNFRGCSEKARLIQRDLKCFFLCFFSTGSAQTNASVFLVVFCLLLLLEGSRYRVVSRGADVMNALSWCCEWGGWALLNMRLWMRTYSLSRSRSRSRSLSHTLSFTISCACNLHTCVSDASWRGIG